MVKFPLMFGPCSNPCKRLFLELCVSAFLEVVLKLFIFKSPIKPIKLISWLSKINDSNG